MTRTAKILFAVLFALFGFVLGLFFAPAILGKSEQKIQSAEAKGFMLGLACSKKKKQEWPLDGRSPC